MRIKRFYFAGAGGVAAVVPVCTGGPIAGPGCAASSIDVLSIFAMESWKTFESDIIFSRFSAAGPQAVNATTKIRAENKNAFFI